MLSDINSKAAERILELLKSEPIAFIGAGLSKPYYKDWPGLIQQLCEIMGSVVTDGIDPIDQAQELRIADEKAYKEALISIFGKYPAGCSDALTRLVTCGFKSYVTTNYDWSIELAFHNNRRPIPRRLSHPKLQETFCEVESIHHLHGTIDAEKPEQSEIILDKQSYTNAYSKSSELCNYIISLFYRQNILFTGYSIDKSEPINGILEVVDRRIRELHYASHKPIPKKQRACLFSAPVDSKEHDRLRRLGIDIIEYEPLCERHSGLSQLWEFIAKNHTPAPPEIAPPIFNPFEEIEDLNQDI
jgi:hypothetical protein